MIEGRQVGVQERTEFDLDQAHSKTEFSAQILGKIPAGLTLSRESVVSSLGSMIGMEDHHVGNPEIDLNLRIGAISTTDVRSYFARESVKEGALRFFHQYPGARVFDGEVIVIIPELIADPALLQKTLEQVIQAAKALSVNETPGTQPAPGKKRV